MLDKDFIKIKIEYIQKDLNHLEPMAKLTIDKIAQDDIQYAALKNFLMQIIGRAIDINEHIIAEKGDEKLKSPLKYRETFLRLAEMGILPEDFAQEIAKSAGFRNAIVHDYNNIDKFIVYKSVSDAISQYAEYCNYILNYLQEPNN
jgi:uncharacterized protein YutE (UPF0331/DUF86 family)